MTLRESSQGLAFLVYQQDMQECTAVPTTPDRSQSSVLLMLCVGWSRNKSYSLHSNCEGFQHRKSLGRLGVKMGEITILNLNLKFQSGWLSVTLQEGDAVLKNLLNASSQYLNGYELNCVPPTQIHTLILNQSNVMVFGGGAFGRQWGLDEDTRLGPSWWN